MPTSGFKKSSISKFTLEYIKNSIEKSVAIAYKVESVYWNFGKTGRRPELVFEVRNKITFVRAVMFDSNFEIRFVYPGGLIDSTRSKGYGRIVAGAYSLTYKEIYFSVVIYNKTLEEKMFVIP